MGVEAEATKDSRAHIVGREPELALLQEFLASEDQALVLEGGPGIGKTTLWEAGLETASERHLRVLRARPSDAEAQLSFAGLSDLLADIDAGSLTDLPAPQRHALEVALLRVGPSGAAPESSAIALGLLNALRSHAADKPLLVAVDDIQWLDPASAAALAFATRRLQGHAVRFLLTKRSHSASALEPSLETLGLERLEIKPLSLGAVRRILFERLGLTLRRRTLRRVFEITRGNPLFALELGRTLAGRGPIEMGEDIPVPDAVEHLLGTRVAALPAAQRRLLLALALSADVRASQLAPIAAPHEFEDALAAGIVVLDGDRVRPSHPLLAEAARSRAAPVERADLHLALARAVSDEELRALHLALATKHPDTSLAARMGTAAAGAASRGAAETAVTLAEHALRLTPPDAPGRTDRLLVLAEHLMVAGEAQRATELLAPEIDRLPAGTARARAHLVLAESRWAGASHIDECGEHLERALADSKDDPALRAVVLARKSRYMTAGRVERIADAEAWALEALGLARAAGPDVEREALHALGLARVLRGLPIDDLCERFRVVSGDAFNIVRSLDRIAASRMASRGDLDGGRAILSELLALADERGAAWAFAVVRHQLCELELWAGYWDSAERLLDEWEQSSEGEVLGAPAYERCRGFLALGRGSAEEAESWARAALADGEARGLQWDHLQTLWLRGTAALLSHDSGRAAESFRAVWEHTRREGVDAASAFPVAPGLVEALVEQGELGEAHAVAERFRELAEEQEHSWGLTTAKRSEGLLQFGEDPDGATALLVQAAADYRALGLHFDGARTLLVLGRAQRRKRRWAAARESLKQAARVFDEIGSPGWAEEARSELARISARKPRPSGELTPSEQRVVELAASGLSNKEIAQKLVVTVNTVERHLSHAYSKLGIRSRAQLAGRLSRRA